MEHYLVCRIASHCFTKISIIVWTRKKDSFWSVVMRARRSHGKKEKRGSFNNCLCWLQNGNSWPKMLKQTVKGNWEALYLSCVLHFLIRVLLQKLPKKHSFFNGVCKEVLFPAGIYRTLVFNKLNFRMNKFKKSPILRFVICPRF